MLTANTVCHIQGQVRCTGILLHDDKDARVCSNVFVCIEEGSLKINAVQRHECIHVDLCAPSTCDTAMEELNFTPCTFAIVRQRGATDGRQGEDRVRNLHRMKKVVTADRGREKVFIHPKKMNARGGRGEDGEGG